MDSFLGIQKVMDDSDCFQQSQMLGGEGASSVDGALEKQIQQTQHSRLKAFYVRIPLENLDEQIRLYRWRQEQKDHIISIFSYHVLSKGNIFSPNPLFKIVMPQYQKNFKNFPKICLSQTLALAKALIRSFTILYDHFGFFCLKEKMIIVDEEKKVRIWPHEDYYINPNNTIYQSQKKITQKEALNSLIKILKRKSLKTSLSKKFFDQICSQNTFKEIYNVIIQYEDEKKIIVPKTVLPFSSPIQHHRVTRSERIRAGSNFGQSSSSNALITCSLKNTFRFFFNTEEKNPEIVEQAWKKREDIKPFKNSNMTRAHSGFISFTPEEKQSLTKNIKQLRKNSQMCQENPEVQSLQQNKDKYTSLLEKSSKKLSLKSCVISQVLNVSPKVPESNQNEVNNYQWNIYEVQREDQCRSIEQSLEYQPVSPSLPEPPTPRRSNLSEDPLNRFEQISSINGWSNWFTLPLNPTKNMKKSISYGVEEESHLKGFKLNKLHTMGRIIVQEEDINEDI